MGENIVGVGYCPKRGVGTPAELRSPYRRMLCSPLPKEGFISDYISKVRVFVVVVSFITEKYAFVGACLGEQIACVGFCCIGWDCIPTRCFKWHKGCYFLVYDCCFLDLLCWGGVTALREELGSRTLFI